MSIDDVVWGDALRITGARAVTVTAIDTRKPVRSETLQPFPERESVAEMAAAMVETAAELVRLTDADMAMDDLLVTSHSWFHVLRVVAGGYAGGYVAHLLLDRRVANLAMARREFRDLLGGAPAPGGPEPTGIPEFLEEAPETPAPREDGVLPRRTPSTTGPWDRHEPQDGGDTPSWFARFAGQPFESDGRTVERVRDGLHRLM
ncbi:hypothetical protein [Phytohabitans kaempferiae]|uniref:Uncharacterized protein n=1 Tax=Phytohabitans kaempferiae TaxID=1620943 RepID=A0ABV6LVJ9_9ACTN